MAKLRTHKQKGQKQGLQVNTRVVLSKEEYRAWQYLRGKKLQITQKTFKQYIADVKKANAKMKGLKDSDNYFGEILEFTSDLSGARTQEELDKWLRAPKVVLSDTYEQDVTSLNREQLEKNVEDIFGKGVSFKDLTPRQLRMFFEEYDGLKKLIFGSPNGNSGDEIRQLVNLMFDNENELQMAIDYYKTK